LEFSIVGHSRESITDRLGENENEVLNRTNSDSNLQQSEAGKYQVLQQTGRASEW
jgi:hypothetical protein